MVNNFQRKELWIHALVRDDDVYTTPKWNWNVEAVVVKQEVYLSNLVTTYCVENNDALFGISISINHEEKYFRCAIVFWSFIVEDIHHLITYEQNVSLSQINDGNMAEEVFRVLTGLHQPVGINSNMTIFGVIWNSSTPSFCVLPVQVVGCTDESQWINQYCSAHICARFYARRMLSSTSELWKIFP